jgi:hypothetical protein
MLTTLIALVLSAQTLTVTLKPNTPFQIQWDQLLEGTFTARYRWWCDGVIVKNFAPADLTISDTLNVDRTQAITATVPGLAVGSHSCFVSAFDPGAAFPEMKGEAIPLAVGTGPTTPLRLRVIVTVTGGGGQ